MDERMFDGVVPALLAIGAVAGAAIVGFIWLIAKFVGPHIHWN